MNREQAYHLLTQYIKDPANINHSIETEVIMKALAKRFGEDEQRWGVIGLLHDIDWELTQNDTSQHCIKCKEILDGAGADSEMIEVIVSHSFGTECAGNKDKKRTKKIEHALAAAETITGLIYAAALVRPDKKLESVKVKSVKKKMKDKSFAAKVDRSIICECEDAGIALDEFIELSLDAMKEISVEIGL